MSTYNSYNSSVLNLSVKNSLEKTGRGDSQTKWWSDEEVLNRICRAYSREDNQSLSCPRCGDVAQQHSCLNDGDVVQELRCTNCSHMERTVVVKTTETEVNVTALPFECYLHNVSASGEKLAAFLLWYDRCQEVAECR